MVSAEDVQPVASHLLWVHQTLGTLGSVCVESKDRFVAHGTHAADFQPLKQAPDGSGGGNEVSELLGLH